MPALRQTGASWYLLGGGVVNNRLANTAYDAAGNQTQLSVSAGTVASYDAENRMSKIAVGAAEIASYTYDAEGRRVAKTAGGATTYYFYDASGQLMAEYGGPAQTAGTQYFTTDSLGSTRMILDGTGGCLERLDYAPFGGQISRSYDCYGGASNEKPLFTGQMRDGESTAGTDTGQDYFNARYLWANIARFTSADAPFADQRPEDGQSWNLYAYVRNSPLRYVDPDGKETAVFPLFNGKSHVPKPERTKPMSPRERQFAKGVVQVGIGLGVLASTMGGNPTGPGGAVLVANGVVVSAASFAAGTANTAGALTNTDVSQATEVLSATSNLGGLATTAATGGNLEAGQTAATITNVAALGVEPQATLANPGTAVDAAQTVLEGITLGDRIASAVTSAVRGFFAPTLAKPTVRQQPPQPPDCIQRVCQ